MSVIDQCRDINKLNPLVKVMLELALAEIKTQGVNPLVVETYRTQERQNYLYCQGRAVAACAAKGINKAFAIRYCNVGAKQVTWTLDSIHIQHKAVDVVPQRKVNGIMKAVWNRSDPQTQIIIKTMAKYGFEPGANWSGNPDSPHFQVKGDFDNLLLKGHNTTYLTKAVQTMLNRKIGARLLIDGLWGDKTTTAVNVFRRKNGWGPNGKLGATALKRLLE